MTTGNLNQLLRIKTPGLGAVVNRSIDKEIMHHIAAWLAQQAPLSILDCACAFDATEVMRLIHLNTVFYRKQMARIHASRAFTLYQFMTLLDNTPATNRPMLIMQPLNLFYDENISLPEAVRLFSRFVAHLMRLSRRSTVIVNARPPSDTFQDRAGFLPRLCKMADQLITEAPEIKRWHQPKLL